MNEPVLQVAKLSDIPTIAQLAEKIWHAHYTHIVGVEQVQYMLDQIYNAESLTEQMTEKQHQFYLISMKDQVIGFISIHNPSAGDWFLNKFYIDQALAAKGIGSKVYKQLVNLIQPTSVTLTVNRQNYRSINFYFKNGFKIKEVADFDIGNGYWMNDFVMTVNY
jgi:ribosomal protein S18 acetylase RimI-like enzyme